MDLFDLLELTGGACLFLFGMKIMGAALEKRAGKGLTAILARLTSGKLTGFLTGLGVTAIIQSSSATTVMVVGFVNSGLMTLRQATNVIMGANVGTTVTAWLLSLTGIEGGNLFVRLLKPTSFAPVLALLGTIALMAPRSEGKKKDTAAIFLGFATLIAGMETMSAAVAGLGETERFRAMLLAFSNPVLGVLMGMVMTAILQSSSAAVGILQALSSTGQIGTGTAIPIIMGQNIGTCVTSLLSSVGTSRNARRASLVHLLFNVIGTALLLTAFVGAKAAWDLSAVMDSPIKEVGIAAAHTAFNLLCTALLLPASGWLERLACRLLPDTASAEEEVKIELDERLMATPAVALEQCRLTAGDMVDVSVRALRSALEQLDSYRPEAADEIRRAEELADRYEDALGSYLVKLSSRPLSDADNRESARLLHLIGDLERISDHAVGILQTAEELREKGIVLTPQARGELETLREAVGEILTLTVHAYETNDPAAAEAVEPLKRVVEELKARLRSHHILRMQRGECSIEAGFVWSDLLTDLGRVADHCANIAGCVIELSAQKLDLHGYSRTARAGGYHYEELYTRYCRKYLQTK